MYRITNSLFETGSFVSNKQHARHNTVMWEKMPSVMGACCDQVPAMSNVVRSSNSRNWITHANWVVIRNVVWSPTYGFSFVAFVTLGALPTIVLVTICPPNHKYWDKTQEPTYLLSRYAVRSLELVQTGLVSDQWAHKGINGEKSNVRAVRGRLSRPWRRARPARPAAITQCLASLLCPSAII